jgi:nucleotide-binding universal stress UspA family protein
MIPQIKRILYATDLSGNAAYVLCYAIDSAIKHDAKIIILHVLEQSLVTTEAMALAYISEEQLRTIQQDEKINATNRIKKRLKMLCEKEFNNDHECKDRVESIEVCEGFAPDTILRMADERDCDAIIMGTHARGAIANTFLGSTAKRVLRRTRKPVYIIPLPKGEVDITFHDI